MGCDGIKLTFWPELSGLPTMRLGAAGGSLSGAPQLPSAAPVPPGIAAVQPPLPDLVSPGERVGFRPGTCRHPPLWGWEKGRVCKGTSGPKTSHTWANAGSRKLACTWGDEQCH